MTYAEFRFAVELAAASCSKQSLEGRPVLRMVNTLDGLVLSAASWLAFSHFDDWDDFFDAYKPYLTGNLERVLELERDRTGAQHDQTDH